MGATVPEGQGAPSTVGPGALPPGWGPCRTASGFYQVLLALAGEGRSSGSGSGAQGLIMAPSSGAAEGTCVPLPSFGLGAFVLCCGLTGGLRFPLSGLYPPLQSICGQS